MKLLVGVTLLSKEYVNNKYKLFESLGNINNDCGFIGVDVDFLFVEQSIDTFSNLSFEFPLENAEFIKTNFCSTSNSRNTIIKHAKNNDYDYIVFHDVSILFSKGSILYLLNNTSNNYTPKLKVVFDNSEYINSSGGNKLRKVTPFYDPYIWSYLFNVKGIKNYFDLNLGPGPDNKYKSGEDVLFLYLYFSNINSFFVYESQAKIVSHPKRDKDFSKHLIYAEGQGHLYRKVLRMKLESKIHLCIFMFFLNALRRVFLFKKNSVNILIHRTKGFFYE